MRRIGLTLMAILLAASPLWSQNVSIPDANFLHALIEQGYDTNEDNQISVAEAEVVTALDVAGREISDLSGIEAFINLDSLNCASNQLSELDVSTNPRLKYLDCAYNQLPELDVSTNPRLKYLDCAGNDLTSLDLSANLSLVYLDCAGNSRLRELNVSQCLELEYLDCSTYWWWWWWFWPPEPPPAVSLAQIDVTNNTKLQYLICYGNDLSSLDVSKNLLLTYLDCSHNQLTSLDLSNNICLDTLEVNSNALASLDVSHNPLLASLNCRGNELTSLNLSNNTELLSLQCGDNQIRHLDISNHQALASLEISGMPMLHEVCVWKLPFPTQDVDVNDWGSLNAYYTTECLYTKNVFIPDTAFLFALIAMGVDTDGDSLISYSEADPVTTIDVPGREIYDLTGIEDFPRLKILICPSNHLAEVNLSRNDSLLYLDVSDNNLTGLNLFYNGSLSYLDCSGNQLSNLSLLQNKRLEWLNLSHIPELSEVCVWAVPESTSLIQFDTTGSRNMYFTDHCESIGDYLEENDGEKDEYRFETAWIEVNQTYENLFVSKNDEDWYQFTVDHYLSREQTVSITCEFDHSRGDINMELFSSADDYANPGQRTLISSSLSQTDDESIEIHLDRGTYLLHVYLDSGQTNSYALNSFLPEGPPLFIQPDTVRFHDVSIYITHSRELVVINQGIRELCIDSIYTDLVGTKIMPTSASIKGGKSKIFNVAFFPRSMDAVSGNLVLYTNETSSGEITVPIQGNGHLSQNFVILKEIVDTITAGNWRVHVLQFPNNNALSSLYLHASINTYLVSCEISNRMLQYENKPGSWVSISIPDSIVIPPGGDTIFWIMLDARSLSPGDYYAEIEMIWSNPVYWRGFIPIRLHANETVQTWISAQKPESISVYPNPTEGGLNIERQGNGSSILTITSLSGQQMFTGEMEGSSLQIDLSSFPNGIYFITIRSKDSVTTRKIIKL